MKQKLKFGLLLIVAAAFALTTNAQTTLRTNPFRPIPKPTHQLKALDAIGVATNPTITAWRFTPMTGYNIKTKQLMAGIGYGIQWMHFVDSTQKYYTTFSVKVAGWVNGLTTPSLNPPNLTSFGVSIGFLNELVQLGVAYSPATVEAKATVGPVINFAVPLNN